MDKNTKTLFITLGGALLLIWILRNKTSVNTKELLDVKYAEPKKVSDTESKLKENAVIGLKAMREAIDKNENKKELDKLSSMVLQDYGIKVLLWIEYIVNFIEFIFYSWMLNNFSIINNITKYRYYDWVITTPVMLFTYSMYLLIIRKMEENKQYNLFNLIDNEKYKLITIILLNWIMKFLRQLH